MKRVIKVLICCAFLALSTGCNTKEAKEETDVGITTEDVTQEKQSQEKQSQEEHPVLSEESLACIEGALNSDDNKKYAGYIGKYLFLSEIAVDAITNANIIEMQDEDNRIFIEVEDSQKRIYVVVVTEEYSLIGIKENSIEGQWVFTVAPDL